jgi:hypothetical protein
VSSAGLNRYLKNLKKADLIITPRIDRWLVSQQGEFVLNEEERRLLEHLLSTPRGSRARTFTGSQAGSCERAQIFNFIGIPTMRRVDPRLMNVFLDGTWRHVRWQLMLRRAIPGTDVEVRVDQPSMNLRGSLDGVNLDERWGFELKGTGVFGLIVMNGVSDPHELQATRYWLATDEDPRFGDRPLNRWVYVYEDKRSQEWREIVVRRKSNSHVEKLVQRELRRLNKAVANQELPSMLKGCSRGKGPEFRECPHASHCAGFTSWEQAEAASAQVVNVTRRRKLKQHRSASG